MRRARIDQRVSLGSVDGNEGGGYFNCTNQNAGLFKLSTRSRVSLT